MVLVAISKHNDSFALWPRVLSVLMMALFLPRYLDPDMYSMIEDSTNILKSKMFKKLTKSICGLVGILHFNDYP